MSAVWTIAKRDFQGYFASSKGAAVFWFFLLFMGIFFASFVSTFVELQQRAPMMGGEAPTLDQLLRAIFENIHFILLLIVPAVTMGSFAEERRTQAFRLLQTAPVSIIQIVIGKFLASVGVMGLVLVCSVIFPLYTFKYGNPDPGPVLTSYLGVFLLMAAQVSVGLWVSSMTKNQFMAFLFTMFSLFLLLILSWIAPNLSASGSVEGVIKYLATTTHLESLLKGLVTVSDLAYFACFISLFLFFTNVAVDSQRWR